MTSTPIETSDLLPEGIVPIVRGMLHGNVIAFAGPSPAIVDTGYPTGVDELEAALAAHDFPIEAIERIYLTHVHSDHAGGTAEIVRRSGAKVYAHPDAAQLVATWDLDGLWLGATGQDMPRFDVDQTLLPGERVELGEFEFEVIHTAGHATGGISFHCADLSTTVTADALWRRGFGLLNPWVDGPQVYDDTADALDRIEQTASRVVIPGHGAPFGDVAEALAAARARLAHLRARPDRVRFHALKNLVGFLRLAEGPSPELRVKAQALAHRLPALPGDDQPADPQALIAEAFEHFSAS